MILNNLNSQSSFQESKRTSSNFSKYSVQTLADFKQKAIKAEAKRKQRVGAVIKIQRSFRRYKNKLKDITYYYTILSKFPL